MLKKLVIAGLAVAVGVAAVVLISSAKWRSWCGMQFQHASESVEDMISPEDEIARLKYEIKNLEAKEPELYDKVAKEAVEVENLKDRVKIDEVAVKKLQDEVTKLADKLRDESVTRISFDGTEYPRASGETQLAADIKLLKAKKKELETEQGLLAQRLENLAKAKEQLGSLKSTRNELATEVAQLESELKSVQMQEAGSKINVGDEGYAKVREDIKALKKKIQVRQEKQKLAEEFGDGPLHQAQPDKPTGKALIKEADELTGKSEKTVVEDK